MDALGASLVLGLLLAAGATPVARRAERDAMAAKNKIAVAINTSWCLFRCALAIPRDLPGWRTGQRRAHAHHWFPTAYFLFLPCLLGGSANLNSLAGKKDGAYRRLIIETPNVHIDKHNNTKKLSDAPQGLCICTPAGQQQPGACQPWMASFSEAQLKEDKP
jgi:hypothetical protein